MFMFPTDTPLLSLVHFGSVFRDQTVFINIPFHNHPFQQDMIELF